MLAAPAGLLALCLVLAVVSPDFRTLGNLLNVADQTATTAALALGLTFVLVVGGIDLSVGAVAGLSGILAAQCALGLGLPSPFCVVAAPLVGLLAGLVTGLAVTRLVIPPFIATLAGMAIWRAVAEIACDSQTLVAPAAMAGVGERVAGVPVTFMVMVALAVLTHVLLRRTVLGQWLYAVGGNPEAARLVGIPVERTQVAAYALSGLCAGVGGLLIAGRLASVQAGAGAGMELDAVAAAVVGGASLAGGRGSAVGTVVGATVLAVMHNGLNLLDVPAMWQQMALGVVIAAAASLDARRRARAGDRVSV
ncbi:ABC transporter permease [Arsenicicoccus dermatophilus]|uniref:ABC transporter permease n=1 Tax=Arsenicicoccus dermatophilus TaxID=1076331 RepID=UPI001F4CF5CE|nr:ABC transporter permease [Arsenicicoccus dermatophilus]